MSLLEELRTLGVDTDEGLERVMGDGDLYEMMLGMFVSAIGDANISPDEFGGDDLEELTRKVHTLKGTTGNLALTPLFEGYEQTLTLLRAGQPAEARAEFERLLPIQAQILACIDRHKNS